MRVASGRRLQSAGWARMPRGIRVRQGRRIILSRRGFARLEKLGFGAGLNRGGARIYVERYGTRGIYPLPRMEEGWMSFW